METLDFKTIPWIKNLPQNWEVKPTKYLIQKIKEIIPYYNDEKVISLSMTGVHERDLDAGGKMPKSFAGYQKIEPGNLLMCLFDIDVTPRCVGVVHDEGITSPAYSRFEMKSDADVEYYYYFFLILDTTKELVYFSKNLRFSLTEDEIGKIKVIHPPLEEQKKIADFLDDKCAQIDEITKDLEEKINKLEDIKKSVIFESVTKGLDKNVVMKESGYSWLGKIPAHWTKCKVKDLFYRKNKKALQKDPIVLSLARDAVKIRDISTNEGQLAASYYEYNPVEPGDLLLNPMDLQSGANCSISKVSGVISPAYINLRSNGLADPRFYDYYFKIQYWSFAFFSYGKGVSYDNRWTLNTDTLLNYVAFKIPLEEQKKIADFLDDKCAQIDEITKATREEIETLKQFKQSLIYEYVTGKKEVPNE